MSGVDEWGMFTGELAHMLCPDDEIRSIALHLHTEGKLGRGCSLDEMRAGIDHWLAFWRAHPTPRQARRLPPNLPVTQRSLHMYVTAFYTVIRMPRESWTFEDWGYLYLMQSRKSYKIGFTTNLVRRVQYLQVGNPDRVKPVGYVIAGAPRVNEGIMHKYFGTRRQSGEWFDLGKGDIECVLGWFDNGIPTTSNHW